MATYVPNADDLTQPTEDKGLVTAAAEFRTLKAKVESNQTRIDTLEGAALQVVAGEYLATAPIDMAGRAISNASNVSAGIVTTDKLVVGRFTFTPGDFSPDIDAALRTDLATTGAGKGAEMVAFKQSGTGAVQRTVQDELRNRVSVNQFGAGATTSPASNVTAISAAIAEFPSDTVQRGAVWFAPGEQLETNSEILLYRKSLTLNGQNTAIKWSGTDANAAIFRVTDSSRVKFCDMVLLGDLANPPLAAIRFFRTGSVDATGTNENCIVENVVIGRKFTEDTATGGSADPTPYAKVQYGILVDGTDGDNDEYVINNVQVHSASVAAINFANTQSIWTSLNNVLVNDSAIGVRVGCNMQMSNVRANRITTADIVGIRTTHAWITGFHAENSNQFIQSSAGASFYVKGGKLLRNSAEPSNFFRVNNGGALVLEDLNVVNVGGTGDTVYFRSSASYGGSLVVKNCTIQGGSLRDTWDVEVGSTTNPTLIDIQHGSFRWTTRSPYVDRQITPGAINPAESAMYGSGGGVVTPMGDLWHVAYQYDLQGQHITHCPDNAGQIRARVFNVTAGAITLSAGRFRWMDLRDWVVATATANIDAPLMTNNTGHSATITLPGAQIGDFVSWGTGATYLDLVVTAYVSAANTVTVRIHNASGGSSNPAVTSFTVGKLKEFGNFQNTLAYTPAAIANAATVTLTCTVPGAQVGAHAFVAYTNDLQNLICTAYVSGANTVTIVLTNYTGASVTLGAGYFKVMVAF